MYKVFLFERVKKKIRFFDEDSYPVHIRLTAGKRSIYLKSNLFYQVCLPKYQQHPQFNKIISIEEIICREQVLLHFVMQQLPGNASLENMRTLYHYYSQDILHIMDEHFKEFLMAFFQEENLPAYAMMFQQPGNFTSSFIMQSLEQSLQPVVLNKLLQTAAEKAPPYIPLLRFLQTTYTASLPLFPVYQWQPAVAAQFQQFVMKYFPAYINQQPATCISRLMDETFHIA